ncbi:MAG: histidinol-phosphatase HisJ family protein [Eubacteriales bacterium]|nr:histidinol-phosphatase HisJ family protein [Eubacteriales bacterium]
MLADYHVHTYYSDDCQCPMEDMIQAALRIGLDEIAFTEHVDYGVITVQNCDYDAYLEELARMRHTYHGQLTIRAGIEFGVQPHTAEQFEQAFAAYPFDFVILSNHQTDDEEYWRGNFQVGKTQDEIHRAYYTTTLETMRRYKNYSVLGHIDMIKRYDQFGEYSDDNIMDLIDAILQQAIADGKGIEVNTSCFKYGLPDLTPSRRILRRYRELGGEILTMGSDAHETRYLADHFQQTRDMLRILGFRWLCTFEKMQPQFHVL